MGSPHEPTKLLHVATILKASIIQAFATVSGWQDTKQAFVWSYRHIHVHMDETKRLTLLCMRAQVIIIIQHMYMLPTSVQHFWKHSNFCTCVAVPISVRLLWAYMCAVQVQSHNDLYCSRLSSDNASIVTFNCGFVIHS